MSLKPIVHYTHTGTPNPLKVSIVMEELGLPVEESPVDFAGVKAEPFISLNVNGRLPAIHDPNTGVTLWESGAIIQYLVETYDKDHKISYGSNDPKRFQLNQWLMFQMSGQGPYFGQRVWFSKFHPEKIQSAIDRYGNEIKRVTGVLNKQLEKNGTGWLVGDKATYADLSFIPWSRNTASMLLPGEEGEALLKENPHYAKWMAAMLARPAVHKIVAQADAAMKAAGH